MQVFYEFYRDAHLKHARTCHEPVYDSLAVHVFERTDELGGVEARTRLIEALELLHVVKQLPAFTIVHAKV